MKKFSDIRYYHWWWPLTSTQLTFLLLLPLNYEQKKANINKCKQERKSSSSLDNGAQMFLSSRTSVYKSSYKKGPKFLSQFSRIFIIKFFCLCLHLKACALLTSGVFCQINRSKNSNTILPIKLRFCLWFYWKACALFCFHRTLFVKMVNKYRKFDYNLATKNAF